MTNTRGNYGSRAAVGIDTHCLIRPDTPAESTARMLTGHSGTNPTGSVLVVIGALGLWFVQGVASVGYNAWSKRRR
jgi:hypothetical protein